MQGQKTNVRHDGGGGGGGAFQPFASLVLSLEAYRLIVGDRISVFSVTILIHHHPSPPATATDFILTEGLMTQSKSIPRLKHTQLTNQR